MSVDAETWLKRREGNAALAARPAIVEAEELAVGDELEETHPSKAYSCPRDRRVKAHTLEFRFRDPDKIDQALDYSYMPRVQWCKGEGSIVLLYDALGITVTICGINLWGMKEQIRHHQVTWVQEQGEYPIVERRAREEATAEGREFVLVREIVFTEEERR